MPGGAHFFHGDLSWPWAADTAALDTPRGALGPWRPNREASPLCAAQAHRRGGCGYLVSAATTAGSGSLGARMTIATMLEHQFARPGHRLRARLSVRRTTTGLQPSGPALGSVPAPAHGPHGGRRGSGARRACGRLRAHGTRGSARSSTRPTRIGGRLRSHEFEGRQWESSPNSAGCGSLSPARPSFTTRTGSGSPGAPFPNPLTNGRGQHRHRHRRADLPWQYPRRAATGVRRGSPSPGRRRFEQNRAYGTLQDANPRSRHRHA